MTPGSSVGSSTAAQVLDAPESSPARTQAAGASKPPEATKPEADPKVAGKLQLVMQREAAAVRREQQAAAREAAAQAREAEFTTREAKIKEFESIKQTNPRKALELLGLSYQDLTQVELADGEITPEIKIQRLEQKLTATEQAREAEKRQEQEAAQKQEQERHAKTIENFKGEILSHIKANPSRYEFIAFEQEEDLVYDTINEHYNRTYKSAVEKKAGLEATESLEQALKLAQESGVDVQDCRGEIWTVAQGADKVEEHLEKKYLKAKELAKVKALLVQRPVQKAVEKPQTKPSQTLKTLNNDLSATASGTPSRRTDDDRIRDALAYARTLRA